MPLNLIKETLEKAGCEVSVNKLSFEVSYEGNLKTFNISKEWEQEIKSFSRSNQYEFDVDKRKLIGPKSVEIGVSRLNHEYFGKANHQFNSASNRKVILAPCSKRFSLSFFTSREYKQFFDAVLVRRIKRDRPLTFENFLWFPASISYNLPRKTERSKLLGEAIPALEACLFKLAVEKGECWDFMKQRKRRLLNYYEETESETLTIPIASYDSNMLKYFKVAISSQFPSQSFLSLYHVLEYNFLSVSDEALHGRLKAHINSTSFNGSCDHIEKVINIVKKHTDNSNETEMLTRVLRKYIDEDDLIEFIESIERTAEDKLYTKSREVFGERFQVQTKKDHAISNVANLLKHVRNALVHSSDRYNRDDCHIPLTDSEYIVEDYIPLIRYLAEKVIYAKSS